MKRIVVIGASGFFGRLILERLRAAGLQALGASRSQGDLRLDAEDPGDLRENLRQRDLVIDAAGPFQTRTPALVDTAMRVGFDLIDLSDSAEYTRKIYEREAPIGAAGIRVLPACSALSAVSALAIRRSGIDQPQRLSAYLLPASGHTANPGAVGSFLASVLGAARTIRFAPPLGDRSGMALETVDGVTLPRVFPSLRTVDFTVDSGMGPINAALRLGFVRKIAMQHQEPLIKLARRLGPKRGVLGYVIASTLRHKELVFTGERIFMTAALPSVLAATAIAAGQFTARGVVPPQEQIDPEPFLAAVRAEGITITG